MLFGETDVDVFLHLLPLLLKQSVAPQDKLTLSELLVRQFDINLGSAECADKHQDADDKNDEQRSEKKHHVLLLPHGLAFLHDLIDTVDRNHHARPLQLEL